MAPANPDRTMALIPAGIAMVLVILGITFWLVGRHESSKDAARLA